jgi:hypothetical protein
MPATAENRGDKGPFRNKSAGLEREALNESRPAAWANTEVISEQALSAASALISAEPWAVRRFPDISARAERESGCGRGDFADTARSAGSPRLAALAPDREAGHRARRPPPPIAKRAAGLAAPRPRSRSGPPRSPPPAPDREAGRWARSRSGPRGSPPCRPSPPIATERQPKTTQHRRQRQPYASVPQCGSSRSRAALAIGATRIESPSSARSGPDRADSVSATDRASARSA